MGRVASIEMTDAGGTLVGASALLRSMSRMCGHGGAGAHVKLRRKGRRVVRRNTPSASEFARLWDQLPASQQRSLIIEIQAALREVKNAGAINTVHEPFSGTHSHPHHAYGSQGGDQNHGHEHTHDNDANHNHTHEQASARTGRHIRFEHGQVQLLNSARKPSAAWDRLVRDLGRGRT
jgi:hypothetical protein